MAVAAACAPATFASFFEALRRAGVPTSIREYLDLLTAVDRGLARFDVEAFYHLSRAVLVKDERHFNRFDQVFAHVFRGLESPPDAAMADIPKEWIAVIAELNLSDEEKAQIQAMGGLDKLLETLRQRLEEQKGRHQGGSKWVGTAGTSPYGSGGYNPEGVRIGDEGERQGRAVKVWERREFKDLAGDVELGTRAIKLALRRLRRFAREGAAEELDLPGTIGATARNGGLLDLKLVPERHNAAKVLLLLDVGGSMDPHVRRCERLFSAARGEFRHLEHFYFHNCVYESLWRENRRRHDRRIDTWEIIHTYPPDWRVVIVGDAAMAPYELTAPGGSVEHYNPEAGEVWLRRLARAFPRTVWINP
ncbi:MAG: VWA domain-containing protein, partial [Alphaproteobacteria bacterium]|nr:VWA domain-containing protein [Alphaproteobacteria bacterium]